MNWKCAHCDTEFAGRKRRFCSVQCRTNAHKLNTSGAHRLDDDGTLLFKCGHCESEFSGRKRMYCCEECEAEAKRTKDNARNPNPKTSRRQPTSIIDGKRQCLGCEKTLPLSEFVPSQNIKSGYRSVCRSCEKDRKKHYCPLSKLIHKRQETGKDYCPVDHAGAYKMAASLLNQRGALAKSDVAAYYGAIKRLVSGAADRRIRSAIRGKRNEASRQESAERQATLKAARAKGMAQHAKELEAIDIPRKVILESIYGRLRGNVRKHKARLGGIATPPPSSWTMNKQKFKDTFGYDFELLAQHIERQFVRDMSWAKFIAGFIHIDHITPASSFDLLDKREFESCYCISNLMPMFWKDNIAKHDKILFLV